MLSTTCVKVCFSPHTSSLISAISPHPRVIETSDVGVLLFYSFRDGYASWQKSLVRCPDQLACVLDCCGMPVSSAAGVTPALYVASLQDKGDVGAGSTVNGDGSKYIRGEGHSSFPESDISIFHFVPPYIYHRQAQILSVSLNVD